MKSNRAARRLLAVLFSVVMLVSMTPTAFATTSPTQDIIGSYSGDAGTPVYKYSYSWSSMKFEYRAGNSGTWNPDTHQFTGGASAGGWYPVANSNDITVINHSNGPITVKLTFTPKKAGMKFAFSKNNFVLPTAVGTTPDNAPSESLFVGPTDDCPGLSAGDTDVVLGTVTLNVSGGKSVS